MRTKKGFTLIELLVVIAIIGILASVVLVSFPGATNKANDSRIISAISQARTVMTYIGAEDGGKYDAFKCTHLEMTALCAEIAAHNPAKTNPTIGYFPASDSTAACIYSALNAKIDGHSFYCADTSGKAGGVANPTGTCGGALANNGTCGF